jgi:hypothetical protein
LYVNTFISVYQVNVQIIVSLKKGETVSKQHDQPVNPTGEVNDIPDHT